MKNNSYRVVGIIHELEIIMAACKSSRWLLGCIGPPEIINPLREVYERAKLIDPKAVFKRIMPTISKEAGRVELTCKNRRQAIKRLKQLKDIRYISVSRIEIRLNGIWQNYIEASSVPQRHGE